MEEVKEEAEWSPFLSLQGARNSAPSESGALHQPGCAPNGGVPQRASSKALGCPFWRKKGAVSPAAALLRPAPTV